MASESDPNLSAEASSRKFYEQLELLLKRHQPIAYIPVATARHREAMNERTKGNAAKWVQTPGHRLLHSMEACCAYTRGQNNDPVDLQRLFQVMSVYHNFEPIDLLMRMLQGANLDNALLLMRRQQIEIQHAFSNRDIARAWLLFSTQGNCPELAQEFEEKFGLTTDEWLRITFACSAIAQPNIHNCFTVARLKDPSLGLRTSAIDRFLAEAVRTPKEIGDNFREVRKDVKPDYHPYIRTGFLDRPLIDFANGRIAAPDISILLRFAGQGLYSRSKELPSFSGQFGSAFQNYVGSLLAAYDSKARILDSRALERLSAPNKSCDFLLETERDILLVECKATSFVARYLFPEVLIKDSSTRKVAQAIRQIASTARDIVAGRFDGLGTSRTKPVIGLVVTFGDIPAASSPWYYENFLMTEAVRNYDKPLLESPNLARAPEIVSVDSLEVIASLHAELGLGLGELIEERARRGYVTVGEWSSFLADKIRAAPNHKFEVLPMTRNNLDAFFSWIKQS